MAQHKCSSNVFFLCFYLNIYDVGGAKVTIKKKMQFKFYEPC